MKRLSIFIALFFLLPYMFWQASCEGSTEPTFECKADSLLIARQANLIDSVNAWKNIAAINHISIERLNNSLQDLSYEIDARDEQIAKFKNRLDSAIVIIKRQNEQLKRCVIDGRAGRGIPFTQSIPISSGAVTRLQLQQWQTVGSFDPCSTFTATINQTGSASEDIFFLAGQQIDQTKDGWTILNGRILEKGQSIICDNNGVCHISK